LRASERGFPSGWLPDADFRAAGSNDDLKKTLDMRTKGDHADRNRPDVIVVDHADAGLLTGCGMSSIRFFSRGTMLATCGLMALSDAQAVARVFRDPNDCVQVSIPDDRHVCLSTSMTFGYIHGFEFDTDARHNCELDRQNDGISMIGLWTDMSNPDETRKEFFQRYCKKPKFLTKYSQLKIPNIPSYVCTTHRKGDEVAVDVVGYRGKWPENPTLPMYDHHVWMITRRNRLRSDMIVFKNFVHGVHLADARCLAAQRAWARQSNGS
jgi:hypothetical protein